MVYLNRSDDDNQAFLTMNLDNPIPKVRKLVREL